REPRVREPPAELRVPLHPVAVVRPRVRERGTRHRLDAARDEEVAVARDHRVAGSDHGGEPRRAEPVDGDAGYRLRESREERPHARDVAVVLAGLIRAAEPDVLDLRGWYSGALNGRLDRRPGEIVRAHARKRAVAPPDRRAHRTQDDRLRQ